MWLHVYEVLTYIESKYIVILYTYKSIRLYTWGSVLPTPRFRTPQGEFNGNNMEKAKSRKAGSIQSD